MNKPKNVHEFDGYTMIPPEKPTSKEEQERIIAESNERLKKLLDGKKEKNSA